MNIIRSLVNNSLKKIRYSAKENYVHKHTLDWWRKHPNIIILEKYKKYLFSGKSVLDVGCNTGYLSMIFAKKYPQLKFKGIDINPQAIDYANDLANKKNVKNVEFKKGLIWNTDYDNKEFDSAFMIDILEHIYDKDIESSFKELNRIVKNYLFLIVPYEDIHDCDAHVRVYNEKTIQSLFESSKYFEILNLERVSDLADAEGEVLDRMNILLKTK